jgi:ubiquinone/menaquinone biosynthesis C-methylase UbiE
MSTEVRSNRFAQILAWIVSSLFVLGFFLPTVGAWTGPILAVWFVGTQRPWRGFAWMLALTFLPGLVFHWRNLPLNGPVPAFEYLGLSLLICALGILPFTFHRLTSPRLPGLLSTLPFPLAAAAARLLVLPWIPATVFNANELAQSQKGNTALLELGAVLGTSAMVFFVCWFASVVAWMWNQEFRRARIAVGASLFAAIFFVSLGLGLMRQVTGAAAPAIPPAGTTFAWICLAGVVLLTVWAILNPDKYTPWAERPQAVGMLQSPFTGSSLHIVSEHGRETLMSGAGERFPVQNGIATFLRPEDLTGDNGKYNHLYETIGGFYDDTQRFFGAFRGLSVDSYFENYMSLLEVKPGDSVLETSVGTGLNFQYLPRGVKLSGLDLSREMLVNCQANLRRWEMDADLYLGNAENLPFADASFDVVYTAGAFNFFSDRPKAIREMIRVAKPGAQLMIEDETEEYVKSTYENIPFTSSFYKDRKDAVTVPINLVPTGMEDIHLEMLKDGKFYAITFRKPAMTDKCSGAVLKQGVGVLAS